MIKLQPFLRFLLSAIDICAYAVMSNHYHLVLKIDKKKAEALSDVEVVIRWKQLFNGHLLVDNWLLSEQGKKNITQAEKDKAVELIHIWRERLYDLGWYMRCLNESIAVQANKEDNCKGRFWEGRFKSQALLDETALLACMAYVDLNPIRAAIAETPETSDFTSIQQRLLSVAKANSSQQAQPKTLLPFTGYQPHSNSQIGLPFKLVDYFKLVEWTGRNIREDKRGAIPAHIKPLFDRFSVNQKDWLAIILDFNRHFISAAGESYRLKHWASKTNRAWCATHKSISLYQS